MSIKIRNFTKAVILTIFTMSHSFEGKTATYYIDYSGGGDSASGTSTSAPWQHCPGDPSAAGTSASTILTGGDAVFFKGGVSYVLTSTNFYSVYGTPGIDVLWSGTPGASITYDGNSAGNWGAGKAIITDNYGTNGHLAFFIHFGQGSNTVFNNFDIGRIGGAATLPADTGTELSQSYGAGIYAEVGFQNVTVANCYFHELGYWQNTKPSGNNAIAGHGIRAAGASSGQAYETSGLTVTNCEFTKIRQPIQILCFKTNLNIEIAGCYIHDYVEWCMDLARASDNTYWDNLKVHDNIFENYDVYYGTGYWNGYDAAPHQNGIYWRADIHYALPSTNVNFYNNTFRATVGGYSGGTSGLYVEGPNQANIFNNVFQNIQPANACIVLQMFDSSPPTTNLLAHIYNNIFYSTSTHIYFAGQPDHVTGHQWWPLTCQVYVTNNIFVNNLTNVGYQYVLLFDATNMSQAVTQSFNIDYNDYVINNNQHPGDLIGNQDGNWIMFQSFGFDAHGQTNDPLFASAATGDYHLETNSPAIGAGVNLTSLGVPGLISDKDGNPRPPIGSWTLGAYLPIGSSLAPYVSLAASPSTIINGQSTTLTWMSINATNLVLSGTGRVALNGSTTVSPTLRTTYAITATGTNGTQSASALVIVRPTAPPGTPTTH